MAESDDEERENDAAWDKDRLLPIAHVARIMRQAVPMNGKISRSAMEAVQRCVSEFVSFITGEAADKCRLEKRKVLRAEDLIWCMAVLGFDEYIAPLNAHLMTFREMAGSSIRSKSRAGDVGDGPGKVAGLESGAVETGAAGLSPAGEGEIDGGAGDFGRGSVVGIDGGAGSTAPGTVMAGNGGWNPGRAFGVYDGDGGGAVMDCNPGGAFGIYDGDGGGADMTGNSGFARGGADVIYSVTGGGAAIAGNSGFTPGGAFGVHAGDGGRAVMTGNSGLTPGDGVGTDGGAGDFPPGCGAMAGIHGGASDAPASGFTAREPHLYGGDMIVAAPQNCRTPPCYPRQMAMDGGAASISDRRFVGESAFGLGP